MKKREYNPFILRDERGGMYRQTKLVIVRHAEENYTIFVVNDEKKPAVPGYPACSVGRRCKTLEGAQKAIKKCYEKFNHKPVHPEKGYYC